MLNINAKLFDPINVEIIFLSAEKMKKAVIVNQSQVTGIEPTVLSE
jgi:hypothetical protein